MRCVAAISKPDGNLIEQKHSITYLGSVLTSSGTLGPELGRRLGAARAEFKKLERIWSHSSLSTGRKLRIFDACVLSKPLYCLHAAYLNQQELARLDAFHVKCLRKITRIPHSYISRISNNTVLERASSTKLSRTLLRRQLELLAHVARKPDADPVRMSVFKPNTVDLKDRAFKRKRGRPRLTWATKVHKHALHAAGNIDALRNFLKYSAEASMAWKAAVRQYCASQEP